MPPPLRDIATLRRMPSFEAAVFYAALVALLASVWWYPHLFNLDGPIHAVNAQLIVDLLTGQCPMAAKLFQFNDRLLPNWSGHALMAALIFAHLSARAAEHVLFSLCILLPCIGLRRLVRLGGTNPLLSWWGPALALNQLITVNGLYNFTLGLGIFLCATAWYLQPRHKTVFFCVGFALLLVMAWFSHLLAFLMIGAVVAVHETLALLRDRPWAFLALRLWLLRRWPVWVAFGPALLLSVLFFQQHFENLNFAPVQGMGDLLAGKFGGVFMLSDFLQIKADPRNMMLMVFYAGSGAFLFYRLVVGAATSRQSLFRSFLFTALLFWLLNFLSGYSVLGGWLIDMRLRMAGWYLLLAAMACVDWPHQARRIAAMAAMVMLLINLGLYHVLARKGEHIIQDSTVRATPLRDNSVIFSVVLPLGGFVPVDLWHGYGFQFLPLRDIGNIMAADRTCTIDLNNYEGQFDYFPLRFRPGMDMGPVWGKPYYSPSAKTYQSSVIDLVDFDPARYARRTGITLQTILVWGDTTMIVPPKQNSAYVREFYKNASLVFNARVAGLDRAGYALTYRYRHNGHDWLRQYEWQGAPLK